ncbi:MAG: hypothetical protein AABN34_11710 [Acidobacteriota bacterium]
MADYSIKTELLGSDEQATLRKLDVELHASGITLTHKLAEADMRAVAAILISLKNRTHDDGNHIDFALGEWMLQADEWFGKDVGMRWIAEEVKRNAYRDYLQMLTGATLIQLQILEDFIHGCCSWLRLKTKRGKTLRVSDFLSSDPNHRNETLGTLKGALEEASLFDHGFEVRLDEFVKKRNRFVHDFWVKAIKDPSFSSRPSFETLTKIEDFLSGLLTEAQELEAPFRGLFYSIDKGMAERFNIRDDMRNGVFVEWSKYEKDFLSVANVPNEPAKKPN